MTERLKNRTVAVTEHRFEKELSTLIARHGARVISCPLIEERVAADPDELQDFIRRLIEGGLDLIVFFTGVGARFLAAAAESMGELERFKEALGGVQVVARGPKPQAALRQMGLGVDLAPEIPTSDGLLDLLRNQPLESRRVGVQLYGRPNPDFCRGVEALGAQVFTVQVYSYAPASDRARVAEFIRTLLTGEVDAITFTSAPQVAALLDPADEAGVYEDLVLRLNSRIAVAAIGEVTRRALRERGIEARIVPAVPKMGALAQAVAMYFGDATA